MNARMGLLDRFERSERERQCPGDGVGDREFCRRVFSSVRMKPNRNLHYEGKLNEGESKKHVCALCAFVMKICL